LILILEALVEPYLWSHLLLGLWFYPYYWP
jgi:hypothetical protein